MSDAAAASAPVAALSTAGRPTAPAPPSARGVDLRQAVRFGLLAGVTAVFVCAVGMIEDFAVRTVIQPALTLSHVALLLIFFICGYLAGKRPPPMEGVPAAAVSGRNLLAGGLAGAAAGATLAGFVALASAVDVRSVLIEVSPRLLVLLTSGRGIGPGAALIVAAAAAFGLLGSAVAVLPDRWRRSVVGALTWLLVVGLLGSVFQQILRGLKLDAVRQLMFDPRGGLTELGAGLILAAAFSIYWTLERQRGALRRRMQEMSDRERRRATYGGLALLIAVLAVLPLVLGPFLSEVLDLVGIYLLMGLGLNIVVGYAGLLDLGYVAFFAVGAYSMAVLTSPASPAWSPGLTFWAALTFVVLATAMAGIVVGTPVLRMRGDYLAIVTLGFGEIARLLFLSDWLTPFFGGAQGIISIPDIPVRVLAISRLPEIAFDTLKLNTPPQLFYPIAAFCMLAIYASWALENSRIGRAWMAMREDEPVAEVMGVDIVGAKLSAFIIGAILAGFGGALFAAKIGSIFPHSFQILVSITVLVLIIVGGMGSIPGVIVGALVLVGVPELLREFAEYRLLFYGAILIYMMLKRPEGLLPSKRRAQELHQDEAMQDAWLEGVTEQDRPDEPQDASSAIVAGQDSAADA